MLCHIRTAESATPRTHPFATMVYAHRLWLLHRHKISKGGITMQAYYETEILANLKWTPEAGQF
jgi:hypothetical protein